MLNKIFGGLFFNKKKILLAFEYGMILAKSAQEMKVELTPELSEKAEVMLLNEFRNKGPQELANDMAPNILSVFELDLSK